MTQTRIFALGYMSILETPTGGWRGGYLIINAYGRPIEFHYTSEFKLNSIQRSLFGDSLEHSTFAELIGKPLTQRQKIPPKAILVDTKPLLHLRNLVPVPVLHLNRREEMDSINPNHDGVQMIEATDLQITSHEKFSQDREAFGKMKPVVLKQFDWMEPFSRIHFALSELRDHSTSIAVGYEDSTNGSNAVQGLHPSNSKQNSDSSEDRFKTKNAA